MGKGLVSSLFRLSLSLFPPSFDCDFPFPPSFVPSFLLLLSSGPGSRYGGSRAALARGLLSLLGFPELHSPSEFLSGVVPSV